MQYKLVVLDLDGTLLNDEHKISEENRETVVRLKEEGVQFVLASGRPYESVLPYAIELGLDLPIIATNGAFVKSVVNNEVYYSSIVPRDRLDEILEFASRNAFQVSLYLNNEILTLSDSMLDLHSGLEGIEAKKITSFDGNRPVMRILMVGQSEKVNEAITRLKNTYNNNLYITSSESNFLEVMSIEASKGKALYDLIKKLNIPKAQVVAMGNQWNDVPMFNEAGFSVAMANSPKRVQNVADFVTKSNVENGVAYALKKIYKRGSDL